MRTDIYLGIDMGSTGLKAVAFEAGTGSGVASSGSALPFELKVVSSLGTRFVPLTLRVGSRMGVAAPLTYSSISSPQQALRSPPMPRLP